MAAIVGDSVGYEVGKRYGWRIRGSRVGARIGEPRWMLAESFFDAHGGKAVFLGRSQALLRALVPGLAGMSGLPYRRFLPWNALGGLVWGGGVVLLGFVFAHSLSRVEQGLKYYAYGALALAVLALLAWHFRRRARDRRQLSALQTEHAETDDAETGG
jgi:membrane protein DedA with SNARE-associated domain